MCSNLRSWPIFGSLSSLEPQFVTKIRMAIVFGKLGNKALIVTNDKMVYALNNDLHGCLGTGDKTSKPYQKEELEDLRGKDIKTFAYGISPYILALTNEGEVYSWSYNVYGQFMFGTKDFRPTLVKIPIQDSQNMERVVDIACGNYHSIIRTENGEVYAWESNNSEQLDNSTFGFSITPRLVMSNVECISCGDAFIVAVTKIGKVYCWGSNNVGQLGIDNCKSENRTSFGPKNFPYSPDVNYPRIHHREVITVSLENKSMTPQLVNLSEDLFVVKVTCGFQHTLALTDKGKIYAWGGNNFGQLGIGNKKESCKPVMVMQMEKKRWSDIATLNCSSISIAVTEEGRVYVWGDCRGESILTPTATSYFNIHDALAHYGPGVMHKPLILDEKPDILGCLGTAFDDSSTSDFKIQMESECIHVHKVILKIRSLYFRKMFEYDWTENTQSVIKITKYPYHVYKAYLQYLYTDTIDLSFELVSELLDLANAHCEDNLKKQCIRIIKQGITVSDVAYFYKIAVEYNIKALEEFCVQFALYHMTAVVQTENFAKLDQDLMKTFIIKASKAGCFKN